MTPILHAIRARQQFENAHRLFQGLAPVAEGDAPATADRCEILRLGVGMAARPLVLARCHLAVVRQSMRDPAWGPRLQRVLSGIGLDSAAERAERLAARRIAQGVACLNPFRDAGEPRPPGPVEAVHERLAPIAPDDAGLVEF